MQPHKGILVSNEVELGLESCTVQPILLPFVSVRKREGGNGGYIMKENANK